MRSRSSDGCSSSALSRRQCRRTAMCAVGGTPEVSICWSCSAYARMLASCSAKRETSDSERSSRASAAMRSMSARVRLSDMRTAVGTPMNRAAAVAGTWYPGTAGALAREVDAVSRRRWRRSVGPHRRDHRAPRGDHVLRARCGARIPRGSRGGALRCGAAGRTRRTSSRSTASRLSVRRIRVSAWPRGHRRSPRRRTDRRRPA